MGRVYSIGSFFLTPLLNDPDTPTLLHRFSGTRSSDISFAPSIFVFSFSCHKEVLQDFGSDHQPISLTMLLSPVFRPNEGLFFINFHKVCWDDFSFYFDSHCPFAEEYSTLFFSAATLFTSLKLNAAKFFNLTDVMA